MIETRLLYYFLAVAREQNITRAAESLFVTQSTLSKQMMDLEKQLKKQLFVRGKRRITLTEEGEYLRNRAREILELMDSTEASLRTESELLSGDIHIACGETVAMELFAEAFADFHRLHPDVRLHTYSGDADSVLERLDKGLADMGLLLGPTRQEKYDYLDIRRKDVFGLLMPAGCPLAKQEHIPLDRLKELPLILSEQTYRGHHEMEHADMTDLKESMVATYNLIYNATFLVEQGIGYALCLKDLVNTDGRDLTFRPIVPELSLKLYLVTKKYQTFSPAVKAFLQQVQGIIDEESSSAS